MENKTSLLSKILFTFTVAFFATACVIFIVKLLAIGSLETFLGSNAFSSILYWLISLAATVWYIYRYGFPKTQKAEDLGEKTYSVLLALFIPLLIGMGIGLIVYYIIYGLSILFMAAIGYIIAILLVVDIFYGIRFLIKVYFKPGEISKYVQWGAIVISLLIAIVLLILAIYVIRM
jgi:hypothetical protein